MTNSRHTNTLGFTLLEMIITIVVASMVVGMLGPFFATLFQSFDTNSSIRETDSLIRPAMERILREVRGNRCGVAVTAAGSTLTFNDATNTQVIYTLTNGNLTRNMQVMASNVSGLTFTRTDVTVGTDVIVTINVNMTITVRGQSTNLLGSVQLRNSLVLANC
ncbi:MAG: prepilin-type N-terminal cleavage/methylation domain-containing protein [Magnetococcales bacterium]|nr:prepilin-type N-terminal cleavage/methylation domain-containing protein [Magnetococcales bacterium]